MNRKAFLKSIMTPFVLMLCCILLLPANISAAPTDTENKPIAFSEEEADYLDRVDEITIGCRIDNCPMLFRNADTGQIEGITVDILEIVSETTGLKFRYQALPSGSITYKDLERLQVDIVAGVEYNELNKHAKGIAMTDTYLHAAKVFVCKKGMGFDPHSEMTIAVNSGSQTLEKVIKQQYPTFQILFCDSAEKALSAVLTGKADAVLQNQYTVERILRKPAYEDLRIVATATIGDSQCLACIVPIGEDGGNIISKDTELLLSILNKGIDRLGQSQVSFAIISSTAENAYQFTIWDTIFRYRFALAGLSVSLLFILILLHKNRILHKKREEQIAAQKRANELAAINERMKEQQLLLMDALKRAEEANRAKTFFLFNMSHDIRTPMNAILGFTEIASRNINDRERLTDCLEKIQVSGKHLLQLINNVLDMTKIESGKATLTEDCCDLEESIKKACDILQTEIDLRHLTLKIDTSNVKNKLVYCDSLRFEQILYNLLSNAVKFSKQDGNILVTLNQHQCAIKEYAEYEMHVRDNGIGMSKEFLSRVFEPFEREQTSTISKIQGTGLGMSITKNLVDLMGGTISVTSEPDKGTDFAVKFTFKLHEQIKQQIQQTPTETAFTADFSGRRLLLVDDNELNMEIAYEILRDAGFMVETATNGQIAVEMVRNSSAGYYDVILMDIQMPVMDGYQASREIRSLENKELADIPIIALTANAFDEDKKEALSNGMDDHIAKPLDVTALYETLDNILKDR